MVFTVCPSRSDLEKTTVFQTATVLCMISSHAKCGHGDHSCGAFRLHSLPYDWVCTIRLVRARIASIASAMTFSSTFVGLVFFRRYMTFDSSFPGMRSAGTSIQHCWTASQLQGGGVTHAHLKSGGRLQNDAGRRNKHAFVTCSAVYIRLDLFLQ